MSEASNQLDDISGATLGDSQPVAATSATPAPQLKKNHRKAQLIMFVIWLLATILTIGGCLYLFFVVSGKNGLIGLVVFLLAGGLPVVGGGAYVIFKVIPETNND